MSTFWDDTQLCQRAKTFYGTTEFHEDINKQGEWAKKWQMNFNVDEI